MDDSGICKECSENCAECNDADTCNECNDSYELDQGFCSCGCNFEKDGQCYEVTCPENAEHNCGEEDCTCIDGYEVKDGLCVEEESAPEPIECPAGQHLSKDNECVTCRNEQIWCPELKMCAGFCAEGNDEPVDSCSGDLFLKNGKCVCQDPRMIKSGDSCSCPAGMNLQGNFCECDSEG